MSECHDIYHKNAPVPTNRAERAPSEGAQCHDSYNPASSLTRPPTVQHGCWFFDNHWDGVEVMRGVGRLDWATKDKFRDFLDRGDDDDIVVDLSAARMDAAVGIPLLGAQT